MMARIVMVGFSPDEDGVRKYLRTNPLCIPMHRPKLDIVVVTEYLYWGIVECGVAVLAACLPTLQFLLRSWSLTAILKSARGLFSSKGSSIEYIRAQDTTSRFSPPRAASLNEAQDTTFGSATSLTGPNSVEVFPMHQVPGYREVQV